MKLASFTVENYRSITRAHKIGLNRATVLVGPNNEGKSNILRALVAAMNILTRGRRQLIRRGHMLSRFSKFQYYDWNLDFPIHLQKKIPNGESLMILEFALTNEEMEEFYKEVKSRLTGTLPLRIALGTEGIKVTVYKKGRGAKSISAKSDRIAGFIADRLDFEHIPAVRTASSAQEVVNEMVERELQKLEGDLEYEGAMKKIEEIQKPILNLLSESIKSTLVQFLPAIKDVKVQILEEARYRALRRSSEIIVDDGSPTPLKYKGDGVQSLAALGIMRHASERGASGRNLVIAIEEPESHLHPKAIHELRKVISELSQKHQVVLTTHCPLFIDRQKIESNIIVNKKRAVPAKNIGEIREILGVRASDNLRHAELVLLVEGDDDKTAIESLLTHYSPDIANALAQGNLVVDTLIGVSNLSYRACLIRDALCQSHCFLDYDKAGKSAFAKAKEEGLINDVEANFASCLGMKESELEDLYNPNIYKNILTDDYGVILESPKFKTAKKWSERMSEVFRQQGKQWDDKIERSLKMKIAEAVAERPSNSIKESCRSIVEGLVRNLEERLRSLGFKSD